MSRDIRFRAWDKERQIMAYQFGLTPQSDDETMYIVTQDLYSNEIIVIPEGMGSPLPLMQFTGLKDKNGKEIYEGDILEAISPMVNIGTGRLTGEMSKPQRSSVVHVEEKGRFALKRQSDGYVERGLGMNQETITKWYEIVGNIYETKDDPEPFKIDGRVHNHKGPSSPLK